MIFLTLNKYLEIIWTKSTSGPRSGSRLTTMHKSNSSVPRKFLCCFIRKETNAKVNFTLTVAGKSQNLLRTQQKNRNPLNKLYFLIFILLGSNLKN
jgi:hypothetical protein